MIRDYSLQILDEGGGDFEIPTPEETTKTVLVYNINTGMVEAKPVTTPAVPAVTEQETTAPTYSTTQTVQVYEPGNQGPVLSDTSAGNAMLDAINTFNLARPVEVAVEEVKDQKPAGDAFVAVPYDQLSNDIKKVLELNGAPLGMSGKQYYDSRGGVNASGYYGDSYIQGVTLTDAEYQAAIDKATQSGATGVGFGDAINKASAVKKYEASVESGADPDAALNQLKEELSGTQNMLEGTGYEGEVVEIELPEGLTEEDIATLPSTTGTVTAPTGDGEAPAPTPGGTGETVIPPPTGKTQLPPPSTPPVPGQTYTAPDGRIFTDLTAYNAYLEQIKVDEKLQRGQSAFQLLKGYLDKYGLGTLAKDVESYMKDGISYDEMLLKLRTESPAYKKRFAANERRITKGLRALSEAEYIGLEDQYQNIMRQYGLPSSYYTETTDPTTGIKVQQGFEKFIEGDVSPAELEDRILTAQNRILYANPEVGIALKTFYPDISNGDLLAYALDPDKALAQIKRRISAAEIGASAVQLGLTTSATDAEYLARYGVTKEQAQQGYRAVAEVLPRASFLGDVYGKQGMGPYTQQTAEREIFNVPGAAEAAAQRRKLTELEQAQFSGRAGTTGGALARERAGGF